MVLLAVHQLYIILKFAALTATFNSSTIKLSISSFYSPNFSA